jgi:serine O-acetyltransferase
MLFFLSPGFQLSFALRVREAVENIRFIGKVLRRLVWYISSMATASDITPGVKIGRGLYLPHPTGIVIRGECVIGDNVTILQGVTIGRLKDGDLSETQIGDGVSIYAGAVILGNIKIGNNAVIGANAVVLTDVPDSAVAVGVPAKIIQKPIS